MLMGVGKEDAKSQVVEEKKEIRHYTIHLYHFSFFL